MGQVVAGAAGAVIGFYLGGPTGAQMGWALGSALYASQQVVKGPGIGDGKVQTSQDGLPIAIIYGTSDAFGNVVDALPVRKIRVRESSKGGPKVENQRALQTFAIMFCEGEMSGVSRIWENERLVYDVTPGSTLLQESAKYAEGFRFYPGSETQLPDPDLEAYHGAGLTPAYRGSCYIVWMDKDITDYGVAIPQMRVELYKSGTGTSLSGWVAAGEGLPTGYVLLSDGEDWEVSKNTSMGEQDYPADVIVSTDISITIAGRGWARISFDGGQTWTQPAGLPGDGPNGRPNDAVWNGDYIFIAYQGDGLYRSQDGLTYEQIIALPTASRFSLAAIGSTVICGKTVGQIERSTDNFETFTSSFISLAGGGIAALANNGSNFIAATFSAGWWGYSFDSGATWNDADSTPFDGDTTSPLRGACYGDGAFLIGNATGKIARSSDGGLNWSVVYDAETHAITDGAFSDGRFLFTRADGSILSTTNNGDNWTVLPSTFEDDVNPATTAIHAYQFALSPVSQDRVTIASIVADQCERKGVTSDRRDVSQIAGTTRGFKVAGAYNAADVIRTIAAAYFFDSPEYDRKIRFLPRGRPVVVSIPREDFISEPEVQDSAQTEHTIEYPRELSVFYAPSEAGYQTTSQKSSRYSPDIRVKGNVVFEAPFNWTADEAAQLADKYHKVAWVDAAGEVKMSVSEAMYAYLVPSDCIGAEVNGKLSRLRIESMTRTDGQMDLTCRYDRQSAYTSNRTGIPPLAPTPPPSNDFGPALLAFVDVPPLHGEEDTPWYYVAVAGVNEAWAGARVERERIAGSGGGVGLQWEEILRVGASGGVDGLIGSASAIPLRPDSYIDRDTVITISIPPSTDDGTLEEYLDTTDAAGQQGGANVIAVQLPDYTLPELISFRAAVEVTPGTWQLSHLYRGLANTAAREHASGEQVVFMRAANAILEPGPQYRGATTGLRAQSFGEVDYTNTQITWNVASMREWPAAAAPASRYGATAEAAIDASLVAADFNSAFVDIAAGPRRLSNDDVVLLLAVRGRTVFNSAQDYLSHNSMTALVRYTDGVDTIERTVTVRSAWIENPDFAGAFSQKFQLQDRLTAAEQTAAFGSVPSSLDVSVRLINDITGPGDSLEITI